MKRPINLTPDIYRRYGFIFGRPFVEKETRELVFADLTRQQLRAQGCSNFNAASRLTELTRKHGFSSWREWYKLDVEPDTLQDYFKGISSASMCVLAAVATHYGSSLSDKWYRWAVSITQVKNTYKKYRRNEAKVEAWERKQTQLLKARRQSAITEAGTRVLMSAKSGIKFVPLKKSA